MTNPHTLPASERLDEVRAWGERNLNRARTAETERDALRAETDLLRREAALWRAGLRYDAGAQLLLRQLPPTSTSTTPKQCARRARTSWPRSSVPEPS
jgi:hypothetical protein